MFCVVCQKYYNYFVFVFWVFSKMFSGNNGCIGRNICKNIFVGYQFVCYVYIFFVGNLFNFVNQVQIQVIWNEICVNILNFVWVRG